MCVVGREHILSNLIEFVTPSGDPPLYFSLRGTLPESGYYGRDHSHMTFATF